jgi:hypothetical protein
LRSESQTPSGCTTKFEKILRAKAEPIPPVYDLGEGGPLLRGGGKAASAASEVACGGGVPKVVKDVLTAYYGRLKSAAEKAAVYLALVKGDTRHASQEVKKAYRALQKALKAGTRSRPSRRLRS